MKKTKFLTGALASSLIVIMSMISLTGCQSSNSSNGANNNAAVQANGGNGQNRQAFDPAKMKEQMETNIKSLVDDKTITQDQADKIVAALTTQRGNGQGNGQRRQQSGSNQNNNQNNKQNGNQNGQQGNGQNRPGGNSSLAKLVSDGTITQAQADAVMQKIRGSFGRPQNNNQQNNNQQDNSKNS